MQLLVASVACLLALVFMASQGWRILQPGPDGLTIGVADADWPWWRGPNRDNIAVGTPPPSTWIYEKDETNNVVWRAEVAGFGHGSPIISGDRVFLPTADDQAQTQSLLCFDRASGNLLWNTEIHRGGFTHKNIKNSHASSSAACDGERVYVPFVTRGGLWLTATGLDGDILWQKLVMAFDSEHGYASSPAIYNSLVIVAGDNLGPSFLTALDGASGDIVWQVPRGQGGSYGTPILASLAGRTQLVLSGQNSVTSYDPKNGIELWSCRGPADSTIGTIASAQDFVFATAGAQPMFAGTMCIRADGSGDVSETHVVWTSNAKANVPSPLVVNNRLVVVQDNGFVTCLSRENGEKLWKERLGGKFSASPVLAGDFVYLPNESGKMFVFKAGDDFELVAENDLGDGGFASPVICGGRLYLRTEHFLYCIGGSS